MEIVKIISPEDHKAEVNRLVKQMEQGNAVSISDCRGLQDTDNDIHIWKLICLNHIQKIVPGCDSDEVYTDYYDMIRIMIASCVMTDGDWVNLPEEFMADVIRFSKNRVALTTIAELEEEDLYLDGSLGLGTALNLELFNRLRRLAIERLDQLSKK